MNPATDSAPPPPAENPGVQHAGENRPPSNWREALLNLIAVRVELIQLESKEAAAKGARKAMQFAAALACAFFTWALLLAGGIAAISNAIDCPWYWLALGAATIHMLAAIVFVTRAKSPESPSFPVTRSEFQKDREWIKNLQKEPKSNA